MTRARKTKKKPSPAAMERCLQAISKAERDYRAMLLKDEDAGWKIERTDRARWEGMLELARMARKCLGERP